MQSLRTSGSSPSTTCRSVRQTPHAWTRTTSCPGPGCGSATSAYSSGVRGERSTIACTTTGSSDSKAASMPQHAFAVQIAAAAVRVVTRLQRPIRVAVEDLPELFFRVVRVRIERLDTAELDDLALDLAVE